MAEGARREWDGRAGRKAGGMKAMAGATGNYWSGGRLLTAAGAQAIARRAEEDVRTEGRFADAVDLKL